MNNAALNAAVVTGEVARFARFFLQELKPRGKWLTPFNVISIPVIILGLIILYFRFTQGLGAVTNLSQQFPWGFWIGFDVITGVALAGGAYVICFVVIVMRIEKYHCILRVTVLNGFLAYVFYSGALLFDLGRPWHKLVRLQLRDVSGGLALLRLHDRPVHGILAGHCRMGKAGETAKDPVTLDPDYRHIGVHDFDAPPIRSWRALPDGQAEAASPLVFGISAAPVLYLEHLRRAGDDHIRGHDQS
jgi:hypothetical protein